ncbi:MAG: GyrI-like domain-containing protein [Spirochaetota bacterium]
MEIKNLQSHPVVSIRTMISFERIQDVLGQGYRKIIEFMGRNGIQPADAPFALYRNEDMQALDIEFGFPVQAADGLATLIESEPELQLAELPAGKAAVALHTGPYMQLEKTYTELTNWVKQQGLETSGICFERYIDDPDSVPEDRLKTEVYFLLK